MSCLSQHCAGRTSHPTKHTGSQAQQGQQQQQQPVRTPTAVLLPQATARQLRPAVCPAQQLPLATAGGLLLLQQEQPQLLLLATPQAHRPGLVVHQQQQQQ